MTTKTTPAKPFTKLHENADYYVRVVSWDNPIDITDRGDFLKLSDGKSDYIAGYGVVNKATEVIELLTVCLPDAMYTAEKYHEAMRDHLWDPRPLKDPSPSLVRAVGEILDGELVQKAVKETIN